MVVHLKRSHLSLCKLFARREKAGPADSFSNSVRRSTQLARQVAYLWISRIISDILANFRRGNVWQLASQVFARPAGSTSPTLKEGSKQFKKQMANLGIQSEFSCCFLANCTVSHAQLHHVLFGLKYLHFYEKLALKYRLRLTNVDVLFFVGLVYAFFYNKGWSFKSVV